MLPSNPPRSAASSPEIRNPCGDTKDLDPAGPRAIILIAGTNRGDAPLSNKVDFGTSSFNIRSKKIEVRGEVDFHTAPKLREQIQATLEKKP